MYPHPVQLELASGITLVVDDHALESVITTSVEIESYAGTGHLELKFKSDEHIAEVMMSPDEALTLADTLTMYANASKRIKARNLENAPY